MSINRLNTLEQSMSRLHVDVSRLLQLSADHGDHISELHDNAAHMASKKELEVAVGTSHFLIQSLNEKFNRLISGIDEKNENSIESQGNNSIEDNSIIRSKNKRSEDNKAQTDLNLLKRLESLENELNDAKSQIFHLNNKVHHLESSIAVVSARHHNTNIEHYNNVASMNQTYASHNMDFMSDQEDFADERVRHNPVGIQEYMNNTTMLNDGSYSTDGRKVDKSVSRDVVNRVDNVTNYIVPDYIEADSIESNSIESTSVKKSNGADVSSHKKSRDESKIASMLVHSIHETASIGNTSEKAEYDIEYNTALVQSKFSNSNSNTLINSATLASMQQDNAYNNNDKILAIEAIVAANRLRLESYGMRTDKIQNNVKLMDAEHSALLLSHKNLMSRFTDSEAAIYVILDKLMNISDSNQANAERQELHAIEQAKQIKSAMEKITVLTKRMNNPHLNNFGNMPIAPELNRRSSAGAPMLGLPELKEFDDEPSNNNKNDNNGDSQAITSIELNRIKAQIKELGEHHVSVVDAVKTLSEKLFTIANNRQFQGNLHQKSGAVAANVVSGRLDLSGHPDIIDLRNDVDVLKRRMVLLPKQIYHQLFHEEIRRQNEKIAALKIRSDQSVTVKPPITPITPSLNKAKRFHPRSKLSSSEVKTTGPSNMSNIDISHRLVEAPSLPISSKIRKLIEKQQGKGHANEEMAPTQPSSSQNMDHKLTRFYQKLDDHRQFSNEDDYQGPAHTSSGGSEYGELNLDDMFTRSVYEDELLDEFDSASGYPENSLYMQGQNNVDGTISEITFTEMDMLHELSTIFTSSVQSSSKS